MTPTTTCATAMRGRGGGTVQPRMVSGRRQNHGATTAETTIASRAPPAMRPSVAGSPMRPANATGSTTIAVPVTAQTPSQNVAAVKPIRRLISDGGSPHDAYSR
jgi:hypothetical protein